MRNQMLAKIILIIYFVIVNFLGIASMASDKIRAMEHRYRIPESVLLLRRYMPARAGFPEEPGFPEIE